MKVTLFLTAINSLILTASVSAQMNMQSVQKANGLAAVINKAKPCNYRLDQEKLERYIESNKLDTPEILSWISTQIELVELENEPSPSECTISKSTARKIGILID